MKTHTLIFEDICDWIGFEYVKDVKRISIVKRKDMSLIVTFKIPWSVHGLLWLMSPDQREAIKRLNPSVFYGADL